MLQTVFEFLESVYIWFFGAELVQDNFIRLFLDLFTCFWGFSLLYGCLFYPAKWAIGKLIRYVNKGGKE